MASAVLDTNVILRFLLADEPSLYAQSREIMDRVESGELVAQVSDAVLAECIYVLRDFYGVPKERYAAELLTVISFRGVSRSHMPVLIGALKLYQGTNIGFVDAHILILSQRLGAKLITFDRKLAKLAARMQIEGD